ncbi:MAG: response regulator [Bacteroidota bacterium]
MDKDLLHILLADDDEGDRLLFIEAFEELNLKTKVYTVNDGVQLMEYLTQKAAPLPNILFLDLNMPRKNGLECLQEIKSNEHLKDISVVIYSTSASEKDIEDTYLYGAHVYIKKPNDFMALKQMLNKALKVIALYTRESYNKSEYLLTV